MTAMTDHIPRMIHDLYHVKQVIIVSIFLDLKVDVW